LCIQETKRELFDQTYIRNFCPSQFDSFDYIPLVGSSGGTLVVSKGSKFFGHVIFQNEFAMSLEFVSTISNASWVLTHIYAPCTIEDKQRFLNWFHNIDMAEDTDWLVVGDFNLMRKPKDRNKPGSNLSEMMEFNVAISNQRLEELRLSGAKYT
jgi:exonuclease III